MNYKRIKDPIYGYISIPKHVFSDFIDTPSFQRLRRISQTGYAPLYPSALHNRFVHSLGVYHLGCLAAEALDASVVALRLDKEKLEIWSKALETFKLACLLHDFGHAPFSHAGEDFYFSNGNERTDELVEAVLDESFKYDVDNLPKTNEAAPHEIMSSLLAIRQFRDFIENRALFARCITGYRHPNPISVEDYLENILIDTLHSNTIDVDRLDYLIRDAFVVGYDSIVIDFRRLLSSFRVVSHGDKCFRCFYKSALSVLENVVYARDLEKQWIQSHPVILYEQSLVKHLLSVANNTEVINESGIFVAKALTEEGVKLLNGCTIRLLSDDDIIYLSKQYYFGDGLIAEYFSRKDRRHPVWKSEAEYKTLFYIGIGKKEKLSIDMLENVVGDFIRAFGERNTFALLNKDTLKKIDEEIYSLSDDIEIRNTRQGRERKDALENQKKLLVALKSFSDDNGIAFDFSIHNIKSFSSGFSAGDIQAEKIIFIDDSDVDWYDFSDVSTNLSAEREEGKPFFLFHKKDEGFLSKKMELIELLQDLF